MQQLRSLHLKLKTTRGKLSLLLFSFYALFLPFSSWSLETGVSFFSANLRGHLLIILLYGYIALDSLIRFFSQKNATFPVKPLLILPFGKNEIYKVFFMWSFFSRYNFFYLAVILPFSYKVLSNESSHFVFLIFAVNIFLLAALSSQLILIYRHLYSKYFLPIILPFLPLLLFLTDRRKILRDIIVSTDYSLFISICIVFLLVLSYFVNKKIFFEQQFTFQKFKFFPQADKRKNKTTGLKREFINMQFRVLTRTRYGYFRIFTTLLFLLITFILMLYIWKNNPGSLFFLFFTTLFTSTVLASYSIFIFSYESSFFKLIAIKKNAVEILIDSYFRTLLGANGVLFLISFPFLLYFQVDIFMVFAFLFFNSSVFSIPSLFIGTNLNKAANLQILPFAGNSGKEFVLFPVIFGAAILPLIIFLFIKAVTESPFYASSALCAFGFIGLLFKLFFANKIAKLYRGNKYKIIKKLTED